MSNALIVSRMCLFFPFCDPILLWGYYKDTIYDELYPYLTKRRYSPLSQNVGP